MRHMNNHDSDCLPSCACRFDQTEEEGSLLFRNNMYVDFWVNNTKFSAQSKPKKVLIIAEI